ncbi:PEST proteolytic signal-containing nuclear protein [Geodia barretti]|nr:PEST proteolytic signal-containing nuclear protein [Geodia barretti]
MSGGGLLGKRSSGPTISMKIGALKAAPEPKKPKPEAKKPALVSQVFGNDSDEEEEMPPEAKLRMRNIGKNTPTSSGPNSFYKGKMGFSDPRAGYKRYSEDD